MHDRDFKEMDKIVTKQIDLNFDQRKTLRKSAITFNHRIVDEHIELPHFMLLLTNIINNPPSLKLQLRDQNII